MHSVSVENAGETVRVDVPMRSFQGGRKFIGYHRVAPTLTVLPLGYYPNLIALYNYLGVQFREANFSYSFSWLEFAQRGTNMALRPHFIYNGASGRAGLGIPTRWFADDIDQKSTLSQYRFVGLVLPQMIIYLFFMLQLFYHFIRLHVLSIPMLYRHNSKETLAEWTKRTTPSSFVARFLGMDTAWSNFIDQVVVPLFSAICTATSDDVYRHPVNEILGACHPDSQRD